ncbi:MAG: hypothetical protein RLN88_02205 [Ekhidna sp.]|uniref:hypothetical protein n=1 Tax=Ekhidna sp. TaxID=2608089 RepID=UPI0032F077AC
MKLIYLLSLSFLIACSQNIDDSNYYKILKQLELYESIRPNTFVDADGTYSESFWGDKINLNVNITNSAKIAKFKDIKIRVSYYSKTESIITSEDHIIYEVVNPQQTLTKKIQVKNYQDTNSIGWHVVDAVSSY